VSENIAVVARVARVPEARLRQAPPIARALDRPRVSIHDIRRTRLLGRLL